MNKELEQDFKEVLEKAVDFIDDFDGCSFIKVRGKVVKINLPLEVANYIPRHLPLRASKRIEDGSWCLFGGIPCEIKKDIKNIQYVIEGEIKYGD